MSGKVGRPKGFEMTAGSRKAIADTMEGRKRKEETKEKIAKAMREYWRKKKERN